MVMREMIVSAFRYCKYIVLDSVFLIENIKNFHRILELILYGTKIK